MPTIILPSSNMKLILFIICLSFIVEHCQGSLDSQLHNYEILPSINIHSRTKRSPGAIPKTEMELTLFGRNFTLELEPDRELFSRRFKIIIVKGDNTERTLTGFDQSQFFTGHVKGETNSKASIHVDENNVATGVFNSEGEEYYMEPLDRHNDQSDSDFHDISTMVGYRKSDIRTDGAKLEHCGAVHPSFNSSSDFHEIRFDTFYPDTEGGARYKRATVDKKACGVVAIADYKFYQHMGQSNRFKTANYIASIFSRVNSIYRGTNFNGVGTGYGVQIDTLFIHEEASASGDVYPYNIQKINWSNMDLLQAFGRADQYAGYCLAHLFTSQQFSGTLGLSYIASSQTGTYGGICSPTRTMNGETEIFNVAWTTLRNSGGNTVMFMQAALVTAHEFGHNWGSEHDPSSGDCAPSSIFSDGKYLMFTYSVTGEDPNNDMFSSCSRSSIGAVLSNKASGCFVEPIEETLCGNGRIDPGEECDGGFLGRIGQNNKCCTQDCEFTTGAICSPDNHPCCNSECAVESPGVVCSDSLEASCKKASSCDGSSFECPPGEDEDDGIACLDGGTCVTGICEPFCEYRNYNTCVCDTVESSCQRCCRDINTGICSVYIDPITTIVTDHLNGRPCVQGYCDNGNCIKVESDMVARLWSLIDKISVDFVIESIKSNIVSFVVGLSLLIYIPLCIGIWCYDRSRKQKWIKENSITVRKDRTLAHDEDKRPIGGKERPESRQRPPSVDPEGYMVPLPRRPGSGGRNQIQPLGHKPSSSRA